MTAVECVTRCVDALNRIGIPFMVVGSFSSNVYGIPRSTKDADFVIQAEGNAVDLLAMEIANEFTLDPQASFETVTGTTTYRLTHRDSAFLIELFLHEHSKGGATALDNGALVHASCHPKGGAAIEFADRWKQTHAPIIETEQRKSPEGPVNWTRWP